MVNEGSSCRLTFKLVDLDGIGISVANITTATFSLKNKRTGTVINSRTDVDIKSNFDSGGNFSFILNNLDNDIVDHNIYLDKDGSETHIACFDILAVSGSNNLYLKEEIWVKVISLEKVI